MAGPLLHSFDYKAIPISKFCLLRQPFLKASRSLKKSARHAIRSVSACVVPLPKMDCQADATELSALLPATPKHQFTSNYSRPRTDSVNVYPHDAALEGRDSLGSDGPVPGMVDDHDSVVSADDDYQDGIPGTRPGLWDPLWYFGRRGRDRSEHCRPISPTDRSRRQGYAPCPVKIQEDRPVTRGRASSSDSQNEAFPWPIVGPCAEQQRPHTAKSGSSTRPLYSLFPLAAPQRRPPVPPLRVSSLPRQPGSGTVSPCSSLPNSRRPSIDTRMHPASNIHISPPMSRPDSSNAITPPLTLYSSTAASSTASIPLLYQMPIAPPSTPAEISPPVSPLDKTLPDPPTSGNWRQSISKRPSIASLRKLSLSKFSTRSSPTLADLVRSHSRSPTEEIPPTPSLPLQPPSTSASSQKFFSDLHTRPLPPLPRPSDLIQQPPPPPPNISVFEIDSDSEEEDSDSDDDIDSTATKKKRSFAKRLMRGFVPHNRKARSASEGGPLSPTPGTEATLSPQTAPPGRRRAGTVGSNVEPQHQEKLGKPWMRRQKSGENLMSWGRFLSGKRGST
ncbi:hypothetical protein QBC40DRAFT_69447 [Triangularia verruculosa]|uniref:Uncharacterized protein n=1 Tax=Triangularia verruculosa TaxID=2587418 RepID=A0AAN6XMT6_9PEZI|nr:hypothetical protein QBC40DRAFT_69447 [Triangularia verruculosa]